MRRYVVYYAYKTSNKITKIGSRYISAWTEEHAKILVWLKFKRRPDRETMIVKPFETYLNF